MIDLLYYGDGHDSQRVIDTVKPVVDAPVGFRFVPKSRRDDKRPVWGVTIDADSVNQQDIDQALSDEFGSVTPIDK